MKHFGSTSGLTALVEDQATPANGMVAYVTSSYNSGYQNGDIKGAFLADTDDTDLVGSGELAPDLTAYADQAAAVADGWTLGTGWTFDAANDQFDHASGTLGYLQRAMGQTVGATYVITITVSNRSAGNASITFGGTVFSSSISANGTYVLTGVPVNTNTLTVTGDASFNGSIAVDSLKLADADRSVNNNGLIVNGTVTRTPVATGAELVAYSGFSGSNYLEQPYNADLDFGTGDFCVMGWVISTDATYDYLIYRALPNAADVGFSIAIDGANDRIGCLVKSTGFQYGSNKVLGRWTHVALIRSGGMAQVYVNGVLDFTFSAPTDVDPTTPESHIMSLGSASNGAGTLNNGSIALWRISATAPTADQIAKIYEDEKVLFQDNAACTLYGASDAVTALAHDPDTDLLHVGTSAGRSVFQGLRRVSNTTTAVGTAISASNNLVVEE